MAVCGRCDCKNVLYMRKIDDIIIHCTATAEGRDVSVADIRRWHKARGFVDVGYHYVVYLDGSVHEGRPLAQVGAHCRGHNAHSVGVCYVGGLAAGRRAARRPRRARPPPPTPPPRPRRAPAPPWLLTGVRLRIRGLCGNVWRWRRWCSC